MHGRAYACAHYRETWFPESPDGIRTVFLSRRFVQEFYYIFASSNKAKIIKESPDMKNVKQNIPSNRPVQGRPKERNFSLAILVKADSPYIRVTNQIEDMLK